MHMSLRICALNKEKIVITCTFFKISNKTLTKKLNTTVNNTHKNQVYYIKMSILRCIVMLSGLCVFFSNQIDFSVANGLNMYPFHHSNCISFFN